MKLFYHKECEPPNYRYFVRSGIIALDAGRLRGSDENGFYWPSRAYTSSTHAYSFGFTIAGISASGNNARWRGFPLRCLAD